MRIFILVLALIMLSGCAGYTHMLDSIPSAEFDSFEYHRAGNFTSADITVLGAKKTKKTIVFNTVTITGDYGPFVNFRVHITKYKRKSPEINN